MHPSRDWGTPKMRAALDKAVRSAAQKLSREIDKEVMKQIFDAVPSYGGIKNPCMKIELPKYPNKAKKPKGLPKTKNGKQIVYLIDADTHAYRAAAATDGSEWWIINTDGADLDGPFKYKRDAIAQTKSDNFTNVTYEQRWKPEPESHALKILNESFNEFKGRKVELYVTGNTNFRYSIIKDYKGNRKGRRPANLSVCKQELLNKGAKLNKNLEADDLVIIRAKELDKLGIPWVIVGCDKDLKQIKGRFYDPFKKEIMDISEGDAQRNLWKQIATGDTTDNIRSPKGLGPAGFDKAFAKVDWKNTADFEILQMMVALYKTKVKQEDGEDDIDYLSRILMWIKTVASLVFLRRGVDEPYQLPNKEGTIDRQR